MIETAIVLAVIGLVIGGIWVAASTVRENMLVNQICTGLMTTIKNMQLKIPVTQAEGYTSSSPLWLQGDTASTITLTSMGLVPKDWVQSNGVAKLPSGQTLLSTTYMSGGVAVGSVSFYASGASVNFSPALCIKVLSRILGPNMDFWGSANGSIFFANDAWTHSPAWLKGICESNGPTSINGMAINFNLSMR